MKSNCCLVTGANGFVGRKLMLMLLSKYSSIKGVVRCNPSENCIEVGTIDHATDWSEVLQDVDVIIHTAARVHVMQENINDDLDYKNVNTLGTLNLAKQAVNSGVKRFIFISSIKVNGELTKANKPFTNIDPRKPDSPYGQSKADAEEQLLDLANTTGLEVVIIRPTLVYGPGVKANFYSLMNIVSKGLPLPFACIKNNKRSLVSVTNLVDLIVTCIDHPKAVNKTFLVSDDYDISTAAMIEHLADALGKSSKMLPIPLWCFHMVGFLLRKQDVIDRLIGSLQVDITYTRETLDWTPPQSLQDGFKETARAFLNK